MDQAISKAQSLILNEYQGVLSTHSRDVPGYPFGSVMPYCLDGDGQPVMLISRIAQHTRNIQKNPKVSLTIVESDVDDVHIGGRLTWIGDVEQIEEYDTIATRYYSFFPQSRDYHRTHDFDFYRIQLVKARYIGGFGEIFWLNRDKLPLENPFFGNVEEGMVKHMNDDHQESMVRYCQNMNVCLPEGVFPYMAGVNSEGIHLRINRKIVFIPFQETLNTPEKVRKGLMAMSASPRVN